MICKALAIDAPFRWVKMGWRFVMLSPLGFLSAVLFSFALAGNLIGNYQDFKWVTRITKSLLMPLLLLMFITTYQGERPHLIYLALGFSFLGDFFLLFNSKEANTFFILGSISFILAHICYFLWFLLFSLPNLISPLMVLTTLFLVPLTIWFWKTICRHGHRYTPALIVYSLLIDLLVIASTLTWSKGPLLGTLLAFMGALLFGFSDFLIAMRVIGRPVDDNVMVMMSYSLAQFLLVCGVVLLAY
ncbi:MAG: lysoplasmalogenase family protein [Sphaerochaetaceae bacterium]